MATDHQNYRADIDVLRALAVIVVILFHLHVSGFSGGYVGVDVFFVISGYLITKQIFSQVQFGQFSIKKFYVRRIRRVAPALLTVVVVVAAIAFFLLKPEDLRSFGLSLTFQLASLGNPPIFNGVRC